MFHKKVLIVEFVAINAETSCSIAIQEITTLTHKIFNHTMEYGAFVAHGLVIKPVLGTLSHLCSPVHNWRKFSAVLMLEYE